MSEYSMDTDRTTDVRTHDQTQFTSIIGHHPKLLQGLADCGYTYASPIQVAGIPTIVVGNDTIVEAKNGTGKTLTFVIPTLLRLKLNQSNLQTIILAPTREIAVQIQQCFKKVGKYMQELRCEYFIGGTPVEVDKQKAAGCQIAVGSPGRIKHLLNEHVLKGSEVKSFILDEVDRLFTDKNFTKDVRLIDAKLPKLKQMIFVSASINKNDMSLFDEFMKEYSLVKGAEEDMNATEDPSKFLLGIKQYVACVKAVSTNIILLPAKNVRLLNILQNLPYTQCIIFTNYMTRVEAVCNLLRDQNYKADYIRGDQDQHIRLKLVDRLTSFKSRILVATDLIARGIDSSNVDLVINMDCPNDWATYLHRIGRAGRFGKKGNAFTILDDDKELKSFKRIINSIENVKIKILPISIKKLISDYADNELEDLVLTTESDILTEHQDVNDVAEINGDENKLDDMTNENRKQDIEQSNLELKSSDIELNVNNLSVISKPENKTKSVYGPGISEEESLEKLRQVVKETEKNIIDNDLVNKRHLTADRSFVLFDPEPFLDDTEQYIMKYSPQELDDIFTIYDSDLEKYEAAKKSMSEKCIHQEENCEDELSINNQECLENDFSNQSTCTDHKKSDTNTDQILQCQYEQYEHQNDCVEVSTNEMCSESNISNESNSSNDTKTNINTSDRPQFTDIFDLFQVPDFSLLNQTRPDNVVPHSSNSTKDDLTDEEESDGSSICDSLQGEYMEDLYNLEEEEESESEEEESESEEQEFVEEEESFDEGTESECFHENINVEFENSMHDKDDSYEKNSVTYNNKSIEKSVCNDIQENNVTTQKADIKIDHYEKHTVKSNDKNTQKFDRSDNQKNNVTSQIIINEIESDSQQQLLDYNILDSWYGQWKQQMSFIQTCVRMSK